MRFNYSLYNLHGKEKNWGRFLEMLPGLLSWTILVTMTLLSFIQPLIAAVIMIAFILYWVMRLFYMNIFLVVSYVLLAIEKKSDWMRRINDVDALGEHGVIPHVSSKASWRGKVSFWLHRKNLEAMKAKQSFPPRSTAIYHLVIIPVVKEKKIIVEPGIKDIVEGCFPAKRVLLLIALEEAASDDVKRDMDALAEHYKIHFLDFAVIVHPQHLPGEGKVKGANCTYAAKKAAAFFREHKIPFSNIIVSCFDADTASISNYLSCLTYHYLVTPQRNRASYQPIPVYHNNIWESPSFARVIDIGTSFFQMIESTNPKKLVTFSSHSMSFEALVEIGYWPVDMISDDSAIFWKALIHYDGQYRVVPMYTTVSMDIASGESWWQTAVNIYRQKRRWAWGVENLPIVMRAFLRKSTIPVSLRLLYFAKLIDSYISWATWSILLAFVSWLPAMFASREFTASTVYYIAPRIKGSIFALASICAIVCTVLSLSLLPKDEGRHVIWKRILHVFEWVLLPACVLVLSALPALDAQTRLMLGKYLEFEVTDKTRKKKNPR